MDDFGTLYYRITNDPLFNTFIVVCGGLLLGRITIRGFSLGSSGVFITGLAFGFAGLVTSKYITTLGLVVFMYALGIQGGPSFFNAISRKGIPYIIVALTMGLSSIGFSLCAAHFLKESPEVTLGIYTGSFTNSSSLAILMDSGWQGMLLPSYGLVYPLGLIAVIVFIQLAPLVMKKDLLTEFKKTGRHIDGAETHLISRKFHVENPGATGKTVGELDIREKTGATIARIRRRGKIIIPTSDTLFRTGDVALAVGTEESLEKVHRLLGNETYEDLEIDPLVEARHILVTNPSLHHVSLEHLGLSHHYHVVVTRIWRSGLELVPTDDHVVELGDTLLAVGKRKNLDRLTGWLGKREKTLGEIDLISMSFGIALGIILGSLKLPLPGIGMVTIGISGGALLVGLFLGYVRRFGFLTGQMSPSAKTVIKELGLCLFLAGVGDSAGAGITGVALPEMTKMLISSFFILFGTMSVIFIVCQKLLSMDLIKSLTCVCGGMVSSTALGNLTAKIRSEEPTSVFAACYPLSLFVSILASQILALFVR
ncbi:MAG: TrkA C-terminal domain-containing protein [Candidatus Eremiobacteraeota bacterium]|nr:TrkA C-terminal domain-containing protein [Candidatus Eremiobacteraeota bacterium]